MNDRAWVKMVACMSLDGRISTAEDSSPNQVSKGGWTSAEDKEFFNSDLADAGMLIVGSRTANLMPNLGKPVAVVSRDPGIRTKQKGQVGVLLPKPGEILNFLENNHKTKMMLCGGAATYGLFLQHDLVDQIVMTIEPVILQVGPPLAVNGLFNTQARMNRFELLRVNTLGSSGAVRAVYMRKRHGYGDKREA
jgi:dihydrofolate reductase